jgi:hypothetical protein
MSKEKPKPVGRPPKKVKVINPVRQVGRWPDEQWEIVQRAAGAEGLSVAEWARGVLLRAAKRIVK